MMNRALRLVRVYHDLSLSEAAQRVGLSKSYLSEIEKGRKRVSMDVLEKYSEAFDIPISSLMLFAEKSGKRGARESARTFVAEKALKMLDWIEIISREEDAKSDD